MLLLSNILMAVATVVLAYWTYQYVRVALFKDRFKVYQASKKLLYTFTRPQPGLLSNLSDNKQQKQIEEINKYKDTVEEAHFLFSDQKFQDYISELIKNADQYLNSDGSKKRATEEWLKEQDQKEILFNKFKQHLFIDESFLKSTKRSICKILKKFVSSVIQIVMNRLRSSIQFTIETFEKNFLFHRYHLNNTLEYCISYDNFGLLRISSKFGQ